MQSYFVAIASYVGLYLLMTIVRNTIGFKARWPLALPFIVIFGGLAGLRDITVGADTRLYVEIFDHIGRQQAMGWSTIMTSKYPLYELWNIGLFQLAPVGQTIIMANALVIALIMQRAILTHSSQIFLPSLLLVSLYFYFYSLNISRQFIAIGLLFLATSYLLKNQPKKFGPLYLAAILIHSTAIIGGLAYVVYRVNWTRKRLGLALLVVVAGKLSLAQLVSWFTTLFPRYDIYNVTGEIPTTGIETISTQSNGGTLLMNLFYLVFVGVGWRLLPRLKPAAHAKLRYLTVLMTLAVMAGLLFAQNVLVTRLLMYFTINMVVYLPLVLTTGLTVLARPRFKPVVTIPVANLCLFLITLVPMTIQLSKNIAEVLPYRFWS